MLNEERTSSPQLMKSINQQRVLNLIHQSGPISRVGISEKTGLTQQTVTNIVNRLIHDEVVIETEDMAPLSGVGAGRKPIPLRINRSNLYAIGIDVTVKQISGVLMNFDHQQLIQFECPVECFESAEHTFECIVQVVDRLLAGFVHPERIRGIGVSVQGLVDSQTGIVLNANAFHWREYRLKEQLARHYRYPVNVENDVNMIAIVENLTGALSASRDNIILKLDQGIGGAIVVNKLLYAGYRNVAGEFGHFKVDFGPNALPCKCGSRGCLTTIASIGGLEKRLEIGFDEMMNRFRSHDPFIREELRVTGEIIGQSLANIVTFFNPDHVLLTGKLIEQTRDFLLPVVLEKILETAAPYCRNTVIKDTVLQDGALMAAGLVIKETVSSNIRIAD
ncbi:ROK family transcriptional regulator [Paenibacillus alkaliterrae]|uniref:ROK family transcriptional regulator n=1 Tax=Paenibacillus alkaliterrae TaxID=320909 RepID=UPI001F3AE8C2|nr:ROK family transcriptional regulator [Paenibacillus alkaliterrae]MCF2941317.1 ROK family transcriptional regulator [Paenibacillus alkaliterrae]